MRRTRARTPAELVGAAPETEFQLTFDGRPVRALPGQTIAAALWSAGILTWRTTWCTAYREGPSAGSAPATTAWPPSTVSPTSEPACCPRRRATR